jgi:hypothetical protein
MNGGELYCFPGYEIERLLAHSRDYYYKDGHET